jgi:hypothetical protein
VLTLTRNERQRGEMIPHSFDVRAALQRRWRYGDPAAAILEDVTTPAEHPDADLTAPEVAAKRRRKGGAV